MSKHSPAPWRFDEEALLPDEWYIDGTVTAGGTVIASAINTGNGLELARANARLIAAAPDLLAACEAARSFTRHDHIVWNKLRDAIKKATGE